MNTTIDQSIAEHIANTIEEHPAKCACWGQGWILSSWDSWHKCPIHFRGQAHPEYAGYLQECEETLEAIRFDEWLDGFFAGTVEGELLPEPDSDVCLPNNWKGYSYEEIFSDTAQITV